VNRLSVIVIEALLGPNWPGVTLTLITQFAPAARLDPQFLFWLKSAALVPASATPLMRTGMLPVLVTVSGIGCGGQFTLAPPQHFFFPEPQGTGRSARPWERCDRAQM
jgi:hypothetical protein